MPRTATPVASAARSDGPPAPSRSAPPAGLASATGGADQPPEGLIRLDRPFDVDEFSQMLGETAVRVTVPPDALGEVLRRVLDFMGFGIYVYAISVRPSPSELLKGFIVELQRVDYDPTTKTWTPFVERGAVGPGTEGRPQDGP